MTIVLRAFVRQVRGAKDQASGMNQLFLAQHDFRRFDDDADGITGLQLHLVGASASDDTLDLIVAHLHDYVSHYVSELHIYNPSAELISRRKSHEFTKAAS